MCRCAPGHRQRARTIELPSRLKEAAKTLANLFMREEFSAFQSSLAAFDGLNKPVFLGEIACHNVSHNLDRIAPTFIGALLQASLEIRIEVDFQ
jgi:hypothetical protein